MERRHLGGRRYALVSTALESRGFLVAFSERAGGVSEGAFSALNVSFSVGDDLGAVRRNRELLAEGLGVAPFAVAGLIHGRRVVRVGRGRAGAGFADPESAIAASDGLATATTGLPIAVTVADCVPLAIASEEGPVVMAHVGWRGLVAGVVRSALAAATASSSKLTAAIGPAIGPCHYEVGHDVALAVAAASATGAVTTRRGGSLFLDLPGTVTAILRSAGVRRIENAELCTACHPRRFFSHRRDGGRTGRQLGLAARMAG
jgi:hypothetical protein